MELAKHSAHPGRIRRSATRPLLVGTILVGLGLMAFLMVSPSARAQQATDAEGRIILQSSGAPELTNDLVGLWNSSNASINASLYRDSESNTTIIVNFVDSVGSNGLELHLTAPTTDLTIGHHDTVAESGYSVSLYRTRGSIARACTQAQAQVSLLALESIGNTITELALDIQHSCLADAGDMTLAAVRIGTDIAFDSGRGTSGVVRDPSGTPLEGVVVCIRPEGAAPVFFAPGCVRTDPDGEYNIQAPLPEPGEPDRWFISVFDQRNPIYQFSCIPAAASCGTAVLDLTGPVRTNRDILTMLELGCLFDDATMIVDLNEAPGPITGTGGNDVIVAIGGDAIINGGAGDDIICPGNGNNVVLGGTGDDRVLGGIGTDDIRGQDGDDILVGNDGPDRLSGGDGDDNILGQAGDDEISGGADNDTMRGGEGNDTIRGRVGDDSISGDEGDDILSGNGGADVLLGGPGNDQISGGPRPDTIVGGEGDDVLRGLGGADQIDGSGGDDDLRGGKQSDFLNGGDGEDTCRGGTTLRDPQPGTELPFEGDRDAQCETHIEVEFVDSPPTLDGN